MSFRLQYFLLLSVLTIVLTEGSKYILDLNSLIYNVLSEKLTTQQIETFFTSQKKWAWLRFVIVPMILLIKTQMIALVLGAGAFFFDQRISHKKIWGIVLKAEFIFLLVTVIKIVWLYSFKENYTLEDVQNFYPLSALSIIGYKNLQTWWIYPLQLLNAFEVLYWIILALLIDRALNITNGNTGIKIVASSYGPALLIWIGVVMFFTLNMS